MELKQVIANRRSIRRFKKDEVNDQQVREILESARLAPSAKNRQPWKFIVLRNEKKDAIADIMIRWSEDNMNYQDQHGQKTKNSVKPTALAIKEAPVLILVYKKSASQWTNSDVLSIGASVEHICLTATDLGLGSLWICDVRYVMNEINKYLDMNDMELSTAISIGYADENPSQRPRLKYEEIIINN